MFATPDHLHMSQFGAGKETPFSPYDDNGGYVILEMVYI